MRRATDGGIDMKRAKDGPITSGPHVGKVHPALAAGYHSAKMSGVKGSPSEMNKKDVGKTNAPLKKARDTASANDAWDANAKRPTTREPTAVQTTITKQHPSGAKVTKATSRSYESAASLAQAKAVQQGGAMMAGGGGQSGGGGGAGRDEEQDEKKPAKDATPALGSSLPKAKPGSIKTSAGKTGMSSKKAPIYNRPGKDEVADTPEHAVEHIKGADVTITRQNSAIPIHRAQDGSFNASDGWKGRTV